MKKITIIILACLAIAGVAYAQVTEEWVARYDGPTNSMDGAHVIAIDDEGNVYVLRE